MDWRVFLAAAAIAALTGLVFGIFPAWQGSRASAAEALATSARSTGARAQAQWRAALTAAEVALSVILLVGAGLLLHSFVRLMGVPLGFQPERVLAMNINLPDTAYPAPDARLRFFQTLEDRVAALPGVRSVAFANRMPMRGGWSSGFQLGSAREDYECGFQAVNPGYFDTLGMRLDKGRRFTAGDRMGFPPVAIVNEAFTRRYFAGRDAVGAEVLYRQRRVLIVGVVNDIRRGGKTAALDPQLYLPAAQDDLYPVKLADFAVRTEGDPHQLIGGIQRAVWSLDKDQPVTNVRTLEEIISLSASERRFQMLLLAAFAAVALLLATVGIFSVLSYIVNQRMSEMGIRVALGATPGRIVSMVLRQAGGWIGAGIAVGLAGAFMLARYMESLLFEVGGHDAWAYAGAVGLMLFVALAAALIPAARGARVDPMTALRWE
jgi:putative ABC transport system permease protein